MKFIGVFITLLAVAYGNVCENPTVDSVAYTTTDGTLVSKIAFLSDFTVSCSNGAKDLSLYADTGANIISVARAGALNYQVSWTEEISAVGLRGEERQAVRRARLLCTQEGPAQWGERGEHRASGHPQHLPR